MAFDRVHANATSKLDRPCDQGARKEVLSSVLLPKRMEDIHFERRPMFEKGHGD